MDFTLTKYKQLLLSLKKAGYSFLTMEDYAKGNYQSDEKVAVMRHDVDLMPLNSLRMAQMESELGVRATYYFRVVRESNQPNIIRAIAMLHHEIGYHYEDMALEHGDIEKAYAHFCTKLNYFRSFYPVTTICMHGAPTSKYDGRDLWKSHDYKQLGVVCEPYLDLDYSKLFYLTDTGRRWDGYKVSLRDKIPVYQDQWNKEGLVFHTTTDIIQAVQNGKLPSKVLFTTHPQRWNDKRGPWARELTTQMVKNLVKRGLIIIKK